LLIIAVVGIPANWLFFFFPRWRGRQHELRLVSWPRITINNIHELYK